MATDDHGLGAEIVDGDEIPERKGHAPMGNAEERRLADRDELRELRARYSHCWDNGRPEDFVDLFTEDAVLQMATQGLARGREAIRAAVKENIDRSDFVVHFTCDELTEFTGELTAHGTCRFAVQAGRAGSRMGAGTYVDEYRKTDDGWKFVSRVQRFFYMGSVDLEWPPTPDPVTKEYA